MLRQIGIILLALIPVSSYTNTHNGFTSSNIAQQHKYVHYVVQRSPLCHSKGIHGSHSSMSRKVLVTLKSQNDPSGEDDEKDNSPSSILSRFTSPRISDAGLPLADTLLAQIVAPSLQVFWLAANRAPSPTWLQPLFPTNQLFVTRGSLFAPTLIHGAGLACCWLAGALAAKGFESEAFDVSNNKGYGVVIERLIKAGAFAIGMLILGTQLDLFWEFGGRYVQLGESEETDIRLLSAVVEIINDSFFEGIILGSWRLYRASLTADEQ